MALARAYAVGLIGLDGHVVEVEADLAQGIPGLTVIGLPDAALGEARDRVRAAIVSTATTSEHLPPALVAAREEAARAYADARRLIYDRLPPGGLDRALLDGERFRALERFEAAEAELDRLRVESQLATNGRGREPGGDLPDGGGDDEQRPSTRP